jgi:hypothetical protein
MDGSLYSQIHELLGENLPVTAFVDMDGVLTEYRYGEGNLILSGDIDVYLNKRPIQSVIDFIASYYDVNNNEFIILTSCITREQEQAKLKWIKEHMRFFNPKDFVCILSDDFNQRIEKKVSFICDHAKTHPEENKTIVIEDTHEILKKCWESSLKKILPVHVINLIR